MNLTTNQLGEFLLIRVHGSACIGLRLPEPMMKVDTFEFGGILAGFKFAGAIVYDFWHYTFQMRVNGVEIDGVEVAPGKTHMKALGFTNQVEVKIMLHIA